MFHALQVEHSTIGFPSLSVAPHTQCTLSVSCKTVTDLAVVETKAGREVEGAIEVVVEPERRRETSTLGVEIQWAADRAVALKEYSQPRRLQKQRLRTLVQWRLSRYWR